MEAEDLGWIMMRHGSESVSRWYEHISLHLVMEEVQQIWAEEVL